MVSRNVIIEETINLSEDQATGNLTHPEQTTMKIGPKPPVQPKKLDSIIPLKDNRKPKW